MHTYDTLLSVHHVTYTCRLRDSSFILFLDHKISSAVRSAMSAAAEFLVPTQSTFAFLNISRMV